jgi:hypothetical protein
MPGAFADAGKAAELGEDLGYAVDTAVAVEMLALAHAFANTPERP